METEQDEINSLTALIAKESAAAHEALRLELDNFDDLSLSEDDNAEDDELIIDLPQCNTKQTTSQHPIGLGSTERVEDSLRLLRGHLTTEEMDFIIKCPPDEDGGTSLQRCMILNRSKRMELLKSYQHYSNLMWKIVCEEKNVSISSGRQVFNQWLINKVSAPYFKIDKGFSHPPNADVLQMRANGELSVYFIASGRRRWTVENQANLRGAIRLSHYTNKKMKLERDLKYLHSKLARCQNEEMKNDYADQINNFQEELRINEVNYENHFPSLDNEEFIDWDDISIKDIQGKFSSATCKAMWRLYLHPQINNEDWQASEIERVHDIVAHYNYQCWEDIAVELGTGRSPYILCMHFFSTLVDRYDRNPFLPEESARLKEIINKYLMIINDRRANKQPGNSGYNYIPWAKVARDFGNTRSRTQLYMHYMYRIRDRETRNMGSFTASEDVQILYLVNKYGENYSLIAEHMKRSSVQLRSHYLQSLKSMDTEHMRCWTVEDDKKLLDMVKLFGNRYAMIGREMCRPVGSIRGRILTIRRYTETGTALEDMPRRRKGNKLLIKRFQSKVLAEALADANAPLDVDYLRDTFNEKPKRLPGEIKLGRPSLKFDAVDQQLVTYFKMTAGLGRNFKLRQISEEHLNRCATSIRNIFSTLKVNNLEIPSTEELKAYGDGSFDDVDHYLLMLLRKTIKNDNHDEDDLYLPPNTSSLCALKGLIIGSKSSDGNIKNAELRQLFSNDLEELHEDTRTAVSGDRNIFKERLITMFLWPSLCSLQSVSDSAMDTEEPDTISLPEVIPNEPKPKGRPKRDLTKINLMNKARLKERKKRMRTKREPNNDTDSSYDSTELTDTSLATDDIQLDNLPSTSQQQPRLKISVKQKLVLNKTAATSVEEVNQLLKVGESMGGLTKTLVKVDKKTMEKMQRQTNLRQSTKRMKFAKAYPQSRTTRSTIKSDLKKSTNDANDTDSDVDLKIDINKLDSILRSTKCNVNTRSYHNKSMPVDNRADFHKVDVKHDISESDVLSLSKSKVRTYSKRSVRKRSEDNSEITELQSDISKLDSLLKKS